MDKQFPSLDRLSGLNISSMDDFDLASLGLILPTEDEPEEEQVPAINPLHDMDSLDFHLWMEEEVDKERMRRLAQKKANQTDEKK